MTMSAPSPSRGDLPAPLAVPGGGVAGAEVIAELPAEVALWVWNALRAVLLWAGEEAEGREGLFETEAMEAWERELLTTSFDAEVRCPLAVLAREMTHAAEASPARVAWTCLCVADWALGKRAVGTALAFAEAAALSWPDHTRYAWTAGRLLRAHGRVRDADLWLRRAARLSADRGDWEGQARSLTALGNLYVHSGNYPRARDLHRQVLRVSQRHHLHDQEAMALHDLFVVATLTSDFGGADDYARRAFEAYGPHHPRTSALAYDVAYFWMQQADFSSALTVLLAMRGHFAGQADETVRVLGSIARAAGACGRADLFNEAYREGWALVPTIQGGRFPAPALVEMGEGALKLGQMKMAERALLRSREIAAETNQPHVLLRAEELIEKLGEAREEHERLAPSAVPVAPQRETLARVIASNLAAF